MLSEVPMARNPDNLIPTRRSLLSRLKNLDDQESWNDFSRIYRGLVYGVARQAGLTDSEAQDIVQETFISVVKTIQEFKYDPAVGSFKSWLRLIGPVRIQVVDPEEKRALIGLAQLRQGLVGNLRAAVSTEAAPGVRVGVESLLEPFPGLKK